jgi:uncharacterized membrane protein
MTTPSTKVGPSANQGWLEKAIDNANRLWSSGEHFVRSNLTWNRIYRATSYLRSALWVVPLLAIVLVLIVAPTLRVIDNWLGWHVAGLTVGGAQSLYQTVITLTLSFLVFTFGSLLVAIQIAGGQLTPRIIATTLLRDNVVRYSVGLFVFTLITAVTSLNRLDTIAHDIVTFFTACLGIACMANFLFLIDYAARLLRPVSILARVGDEGLAVIDTVYPSLATDLPEAVDTFTPPTMTRRVVPHAGRSEILLAVDLDTLVREAKRLDGTIAFVPHVGDFVADGEPLFALYGGAVAFDDEKLRATAAFGPERTMEQDPLFSFRIMVDIALKALSPAINDPTTAVLSLDQIHRLLRVVGQRQLRGEIIADEGGAPRVIYCTPNWEDFVHVSCQEIRSCGASNIQIARRMRAMLNNLISSLPLHRHGPLVQECRLLDRAIESAYTIPEDLALARMPDSQGLGGTSESRTPDLR